MEKLARAGLEQLREVMRARKHPGAARKQRAQKFAKVKSQVQSAKTEALSLEQQLERIQEALNQTMAHFEAKEAEVVSREKQVAAHAAKLGASPRSWGAPLCLARSSCKEMRGAGPGSCAPSSPSSSPVPAGPGCAPCRASRSPPRSALNRARAWLLLLLTQALGLMGHVQEPLQGPLQEPSGLHNSHLIKKRSAFCGIACTTLPRGQPIWTVKH
eukprot:9477536-Pyramimonas_sp.AAC.1